MYIFQFFDYETYDFNHGNISEKAIRKTSLRKNPYYSTIYVFWSKVILMEIIPYCLISILNGFIIAKIYSSSKFRQQFVRRPSPTHYRSSNPAICEENVNQNEGKLFIKVSLLYISKWANEP